MRELGGRGRSYGVGRPPSAPRNRKCATVGWGFGFCSANDTSNGTRVLPSAKYQWRCSFGSGGGGGTSAVADLAGCRARVSEVRDVTPRRTAAIAWATFRIPAP